MSRLAPMVPPWVAGDELSRAYGATLYGRQDVCGDRVTAPASRTGSGRRTPRRRCGGSSCRPGTPENRIKNGGSGPITTCVMTRLRSLRSTTVPVALVVVLALVLAAP